MFAYVQAFSRLTRSSDAVSVLFATAIGGVLAGVDDLSLMATMCASLVALFSGSVAINDYFDIAEDRINAPDRPLVTEILPLRLGLSIGLILLAIGISAAALLSVNLALMALLVCLLSLAYSYRLKDVPFLGNLVVALVSAYSFACWAFYLPVPEVFWWVAIALTLVRLGGELLKTAHDEPGDAAVGRTTLATALSSQSTARLGLVALIAGLAVVLAVAAVTPTTPLYLAVQCFCLALVGWAFVLLRQQNRHALKRLITIERTITATFMLAVLFGLPDHSLVM